MKTALVLLIILMLSTLFFAFLYRPTSPLEVPGAPKAYFNVTMSLTGMQPERIEVKTGTRVILNVTASDVEHFFGIIDYGINRRVPARQTVTVDFLASRVGNFTYQCMIVSADHLKERGTLSVTP